MSDPRWADERLADALWWFKGFAAASPGCAMIEGGASDVADLANSLRDIRVWLEGLSTGRYRLLGTDENERGVAITEAEMECLFDALRESSTERDRACGREVIQRVHVDFRKAAKIAADRRNPEAPF